MDNFDRKLKDIGKNEAWEIPKEIDDNISKLLEDLEKPSIARYRPLKVSILVAAISALTLTTAFAVGHIIDYFNINKDSSYISTKDELIELGTNVGLSTTDKSIEFTVDSISADDNYINIFYTLKSDKNIKEINEYYEESFFAMPFLDINVDGKEIWETTMTEQEGKYISDNELKCVRRLNISHEEVKDKFDITVSTDKIFKQKGKWEISTKIDKTEAVKASKNYEVDKDFTVRRIYKHNDKDTTLNHKLSIDKVIISPLASQLVVNEEIMDMDDDWQPSIDYGFALFDQDGEYLEVIDKGLSMPASGTMTTSYEFIRGNKDITSLKYVPVQYNEESSTYDLEAKDIDKLPMEFEVSENGKWIIEDIEFKDTEIVITGYKEGFVSNSSLLNVMICDENGEYLDFDMNKAPLVTNTIDRNTRKQICRITFKDKYKEEIQNIKKIKMSRINEIELLEDQAVEIDLTKVKKNK